MARTGEPQISFADVEFMQQGICLDPILQTISDFLNQHAAMIEQVRADLQRGLKKPTRGRHGLTPSQVLRSLVLRRTKDWDLRELSERIADGYTLRSFTDFRSHPVPKHDAFHRALNRLTPQTLHAIKPSSNCGHSRLSAGRSSNRYTRTRFLKLTPEELAVSINNRNLGILNDWARIDRHRRLHVVGSWLSQVAPELKCPIEAFLVSMKIFRHDFPADKNEIARFRFKGYSRGIFRVPRSDRPLTPWAGVPLRSHFSCALRTHPSSNAAQEVLFRPNYFPRWHG